VLRGAASNQIATEPRYGGAANAQHGLPVGRRDGRLARSRGDLTSGESLHLLEGLAEFNLNWLGNGRGTLSLEGPAAMMLHRKECRRCVLDGSARKSARNRGRSFGDTRWQVGARAIWNRVGVSAFGTKAKSNIFDAPRRTGPGRSPEQKRSLKIEAGIDPHQTGDNGAASNHLAAADADTSRPASMSSDGLAISQAYIDAVKKRAAVAYCDSSARLAQCAERDGSQIVVPRERPCWDAICIVAIKPSSSA